ncbi:MAG: YkvA family protein [Clostridia bacterium]
MGYIDGLKAKSKILKRDIMAIYIACRRPEMPWYVKLLAVIIIGYALSPIDLIPDFIPVLGYLDDLILLPLGIGLIVKLIPNEVLEDCRQEAEVKYGGKKPDNWIFGIIIIMIWAMIIWLLVLKIWA